MRILFLSHYFPPEVNAPASRTYEHCREWVRMGHSVTVITCAPNHPRGVVYEGYRNEFVKRETKDGIEVVRVWSFVTANEGMLKRTLNYFSYMVSAILMSLFLPRPEVVISTSPQFFNGLAGYAVSRLKRVPWVLEIRDLWPESITAVGAIRNRIIIRMLEWLEIFAYRKAQAIVPVTDSFKRYMVRKGIPESKISVIKNGADLSFFRPTESFADAKGRLGLAGKFVASYVGTHGMAHHLETILEAAEGLKDRPDIVWLMAGDGAERQRLLAIRDAKGLDNVVMLPQQPKAMMPELWACTDVSLVLLRHSELFKTVIPSKIFESMAMGKPVVLGVDGEAREIIEESDAGLAITPESAIELRAAVLSLCDDHVRANEMGLNGQVYVRKNFDRATLAKNYLAVLAAVAL